MPILWRYALHEYSKVFSLSVCTFMSVLLLTRFQEMARFTALSGDFLKTAIFTFYQLPSILPIAIPISSLLASFLLFRTLSQSYELTALRASGMSFMMIVMPLLLVSILLSFFNFFLCSSIVPFCRRESKTLFFHATSSNPLLLLQRQKLAKMKHAYINMNVKNDETAKDLLLIAYNERNQRLNLISAEKIQLVGSELQGQNLAIVSTLNADTLMIENQSEMSTSAPTISSALKKNRSRLDLNDYSLKMLQIRSDKKSFIEILRRLSLSIAVFSFTFIGVSFAIDQGRTPKKKNLSFVLGFTLAILISYLAGTQLKESPCIALLVFLLPHLLSWLASSLQLRRIARGLA